MLAVLHAPNHLHGWRDLVLLGQILVYGCVQFTRPKDENIGLLGPSEPTCVTSSSYCDGHLVV